MQQAESSEASTIAAQVANQARGTSIFRFSTRLLVKQQAEQAAHSVWVKAQQMRGREVSSRTILFAAAV
jgi:hypothetical protein